MALRMVPILSDKQVGTRLRRLRTMAGKSQEFLSRPLGYQEGTSSNISKIENGERRMSDDRRRAAANVLAAQGDLVGDATVLYHYLTGDESSLDACLRDEGWPPDGVSLSPPSATKETTAGDYDRLKVLRAVGF